MRRREFIKIVAGSAAAWPIAGRAQQPVLPVIGFLRVTSQANSTDLVRAFRQGLNEAGFVDGQNVAIEYRFADGQGDRLPELATDLVRRRVAVIVGHSIAVQAAKAATATTPIIFVVGGDPINSGLVPNLNRPGGNVTGVIFTTVDVTAKRLGLLHELVPKATLIGVLQDANLPEVAVELQDAEVAAKALGLRSCKCKSCYSRRIERRLRNNGPRGCRCVARWRWTVDGLPTSTVGLAVGATCNPNKLC